MAWVQGALFLTVYAVLAAFGLRYLFRGKYAVAGFLIFALALFLRVFVAGDLYLHDWDERFHAVIAKNIWSSPFAPRLYADGVLEYDFARWAESDLWLSKPFLPFWLLGGSITLFGANEFGLRLPSVLIGLGSVWLTYRTGRLLFGAKVGMIAAFLHAIHGISLEMSGGLVSSDHVDTLFTFFFQLSIYVYALSWKNRAFRLLLLTGFLIGLAFLTKWIMAFFALLAVLGTHLFVVRSREQFLRDASLTTGAFLLTIAPWLIFLWRQHPEETGLIFAQFFGRAGAGFEGHTGGLFFYVEDILILFGVGVAVVLPWLIMITWRKRRARHLLLTAWIFIPFLLLSLMSTKRNTYLVMSAPAYFLATGLFITWLLRQDRSMWLTIGFIILLLGLPVEYSIERVKPFAQRFVWPEWRLNLERRVTWEQRLADYFEPGKTLVIENEKHAYHCMFYRENIIAYQRELTEQERQRLREAGYYVPGPQVRGKD